MAPEKPLLWRAFDTAERVVAPRLEEAARSGRFLDALGFAARTQARVRRSLESRSRRVWHLLNLPAASDVNRLRRQIAQLDRELRDLSATLERVLSEPARAQEERDVDVSHAPGGGRTAPNRRAARASAARRGAQRAQGS